MVIAIIGILSAVVLASLNTARAKALDARRMSDLNQIRTAFLMYSVNNGNFIEGGSGSGWSGGGSGWFNYSDGTSYPASIASTLVTDKDLPAAIIDPTGGKTSTPTAGNSYMKYTCTQSGKKVTYVFAKLDTLPQDSTATDGTCCATCDSSYGMNYYVSL